MLLQLRDDAPLLELVHLPHRVQQHELVARVAGELLERGDVLREAGAAEADAGAQEVRAEPVVEADALRDVDDVGADELADVRDLVDEADARREERVRGELHELGRRDVRAHDLGLDAADAARRRGRRRSSSNAPTTSRSGFMKSATALPSARNSGFET